MEARKCKRPASLRAFLYLAPRPGLDSDLRINGRARSKRYAHCVEACETGFCPLYAARLSWQRLFGAFVIQADEAHVGGENRLLAPALDVIAVNRGGVADRTVPDGAAFHAESQD